MQATSSTETIDTQEMSLSFEMHEGIEFEGESITETYSETITTDITNTYSYDISIDYQTSCTEDPKNPGTGLYQWVTASGDKKSNVFSTHTACRYGHLTNTAPECPWNAYDHTTATCLTDWKA